MNKSLWENIHFNMVVVWCGVNWMIIRQVAIFLFFLFFKSSWYKIATAVLSPKQQRRPLPSLLFLSRVAAKKPLKILSNFHWFSRIFRHFFLSKTHPFTKNKCFVVIFKFFLSNVIHNTAHKITKCSFRVCEIVKISLKFSQLPQTCIHELFPTRNILRPSRQLARNFWGGSGAWTRTLRT